MASTITELAGAKRLARAIAIDLLLYHVAAVEQGLREGRPFVDLADELVEARRLFLTRVAAALEPVAVLVRAMDEFFRGWAAQQGLATAGLGEALAAGLERGADRLALQIVAGPAEPGRILAIGDGVQELGRVPPADLEIAEPSVARRHARLVVDGDRVTVEDTGSTGGTFINDERVDSAPLRIGDRLQVGGVRLILIRVAAAVAAPELPEAARDGRTPEHRANLHALAEALAASGQGGRPALAWCEVDGLDRIHAQYGQAAGDELLAAVAIRLAAAARAQQGRSLGRHGGAFVVLLPGQDAALRGRAEGLRAATLRAPVATREGLIQASLVIGVVQGPAGAPPEPVALLERARAACVLAREPGADGIAIA